MVSGPATRMCRCRGLPIQAKCFAPFNDAIVTLQAARARTAATDRWPSIAPGHCVVAADHRALRRTRQPRQSRPHTGLAGEPVNTLAEMASVGPTAAENHTHARAPGTRRIVSLADGRSASDLRLPYYTPFPTESLSG